MRNTSILLSLFIKKIRNLKVSNISIPYFGLKEMEGVFRRLGFFPREKRAVLLKVLDEALKEKFLNNQEWSLFECDLDL